MLAGLIGAYITFRHFLTANEYLTVIFLLIWQLLFCTAVYFGKVDNRRGVIDKLETQALNSVN